MAAVVKRSLERLPTSKADEPSVVLGFGRSLWSALAPTAVPQELTEFAPIQGPHDFHAPSTQADIWFWIHGQSHDQNPDRALMVQDCLQAVCRLYLDLPAFIRHESRDLIGFIDGSANPRGEAARAAALVPEGRLGAAGSFAMTQRWVHDLKSFNQLSVPEQEAIIGRTKADSIEFEGDAMPTNSHVSRTSVRINGVAQEIYRRSAPYGKVGEHGLFFVAFSCEINRFEVQLQRMFGAWDDHVHDRLIEFSTPVTGSYWFVPSQDDLTAALV